MRRGGGLSTSATILPCLRPHFVSLDEIARQYGDTDEQVLEQADE
jgi:hypothetical protein